MAVEGKRARGGLTVRGEVSLRFIFYFCLRVDILAVLFAWLNVRVNS